ncbi:MAG: hypothetical protein U0168_24330 [Nannocystaceae bacterium]
MNNQINPAFSQLTDDEMNTRALAGSRTAVAAGAAGLVAMVVAPEAIVVGAALAASASRWASSTSQELEVAPWRWVAVEQTAAATAERRAHPCERARIALG